MCECLKCVDYLTNECTNHLVDRGETGAIHNSKLQWSYNYFYFILCAFLLLLALSSFFSPFNEQITWLAYPLNWLNETGCSNSNKNTNSQAKKEYCYNFFYILILCFTAKSIITMLETCVCVFHSIQLEFM